MSFEEQNNFIFDCLINKLKNKENTTNIQNMTCTCNYVLYSRDVSYSCCFIAGYIIRPRSNPIE